MKSTILIYLLTLSFFSFSQYAELTVYPKGSNIAYEGKIRSNPHEIYLNKKGVSVIGYKKGYITKGFMVDDLNGKKSTAYTMRLEKDSILPDSFESRKIKLVEIRDNTGNLQGGYTTSGFGYYSSVQEKENIAKIAYTEPLNEFLKQRKFNVAEVNPNFHIKSGIPELAIAGTIEHFSKGTKGGYFQVALKVDWSVLDVNKQEVIYRETSYGYCEESLPIKEALIEAIKDALKTIIVAKEFLEIVNRTEETDLNDFETITLKNEEFTKPENYSSLVKDAVKSVITILPGVGHGSGFFIDTDGYILTNYHVIENAENIEVLFPGGFKLKAELIRSDLQHDVALIKIVGGSGFQPLHIELNKDLEIGNEVIAIGTPQEIEYGQSVTKGIISGIRLSDQKKLIQTDVAVNGGNSGGPLIETESGKVIGIVSSKIKRLGVEGLSFAIPIEEALKALNITME